MGEILVKFADLWKKHSSSVTSCDMIEIKDGEDEVTAMELANCYRCGRLYTKAFKEICPNCLKEIEAEYKKCVEYLRKERKASMAELSEETGVSVSQITKFIREGRISVAEFPNISYACETCGGPIREGNICENCRRRLLGDLKRSNEQQEQSAARSNDPSNRTSTYRIADKSDHK